jgi:hypothetical protein
VCIFTNRLQNKSPHQASYCKCLVRANAIRRILDWITLCSERNVCLMPTYPPYYAFVPSFCPSGYNFAIPSSRLHLTMQTLGVAFGLVGNYLPVDFHHRVLTCPSYKSDLIPLARRD